MTSGPTRPCCCPPSVAPPRPLTPGPRPPWRLCSRSCAPTAYRTASATTSAPCTTPRVRSCCADRDGPGPPAAGPREGGGGLVRAQPGRLRRRPACSPRNSTSSSGSCAATCRRPSSMPSCSNPLRASPGPGITPDRPVTRHRPWKGHRHERHRPRTTRTGPPGCYPRPGHPGSRAYLRSSALRRLGTREAAGSPAATTVITILGVHLVQALITSARPSEATIRAGSVVDAAHAASMVLFGLALQPLAEGSLRGCPHRRDTGRDRHGLRQARRVRTRRRLTPGNARHTNTNKRTRSREPWISPSRSWPTITSSRTPPSSMRSARTRTPAQAGLGPAGRSCSKCTPTQRSGC